MGNKDFHGGDGGGYCYKGIGKASCLRWTVEDVVYVARHHWIPCVFALGMFFFIHVEYTLRMVPPASPPFDLGFVITRPLHRVLSSWPELNTLLAALNTVSSFFSKLYSPNQSIFALFSIALLFLYFIFGVLVKRFIFL